MKRLLFKLTKYKYLACVLELILNILYLPFHIIFVLNKKRIKKKQYYFCVCGIFRNEAHYLKEWIEYYKLIGTDHIYLYNNFSDDNYMEILQPYISDGYITLTDWPHQYAQMAAYEDCYRKYRDKTYWLTFIDIDEFICPKYEMSIKEWIKKYEGYPAVMMYWQMFGTCGIMKPNYDKLVIEQFTSSWNKLDGIGKHIFCTHREFEPSNIYHHHIFVKYQILGMTFKIPMITENKYFLFFPNIYKPPYKNTIQINHYFSKSYDEYKQKILKGDAAREDNIEIRKEEKFFINHERWNICENRVIYRFLTQLKCRMNKKD